MQVRDNVGCGVMWNRDKMQEKLVRTNSITGVMAEASEKRERERVVMVAAEAASTLLSNCNYCTLKNLF